MTTEPVKLKGNAFHLANSIDYAVDSVVSKTRACAPEAAISTHLNSKKREVDHVLLPV